MIARRALLVLAAVLSSMALPAEQGKPFLGNGRSSSFHLVMPEGWRIAWSPDPNFTPQLNQHQAIVFELARSIAGSEPPQPLWIIGTYYMDMASVAARRRKEALANGSSTELPRLDSPSVWVISELENAGKVTAHTQVGSDVLFIDLTVPDRNLFTQAKGDLLKILGSFTEVPKAPT